MEVIDGNGVDYDPVDFQLLFELRLALEEQTPLPLSLIRVLRARGWLRVPNADQRVRVAATLDGEGDVGAYYEAGSARLTAAGDRELHLFCKSLTFADMLGILANDEEMLDGSDGGGEDVR